MSSYGSFPHKEPYWDTIQGSTGPSTSNPNSVPAAPTSYAALSDSRSGNSKPNWKRLIATGGNATTPFTGIKQTLESTPFVAEHWFTLVFPTSNQTNWRRERKTWSHEIATVLPSLPPISDTTLATNLAQTRFYKDLERVTTLFQGGTFLGELRETLEMIRRPAKALRNGIDDYFTALKKRRRGSPATRRKVLSDTWLEYSFGWGPFINDLNSARSYLKRHKERLKQELQPVSGSAVVEGSSVSNKSDVTGSITMTCELQTVSYSFVRYKGAVKASAIQTPLMDYDALGFAPRDFVPTIWELIPWSFAIDYFTNIGDVLTAWSNQNIGLAWGCQTTRRKTYVFSRKDRWSSNVSYAALFDKWESPGFSTASHSRFDRAPNTYVPVPSISVEIPGFGRKWLNLAALAASRRALTPY